MLPCPHCLLLGGGGQATRMWQTKRAATARAHYNVVGLALCLPKTGAGQGGELASLPQPAPPLGLPVALCWLQLLHSSHRLQSEVPSVPMVVHQVILYAWCEQDSGPAARVFAEWTYDQGDHHRELRPVSTSDRGLAIHSWWALR